MRSTASYWRQVSFLSLSILLVTAFLSVPLNAQQAELSEEEKREQLIAAKFLDHLLRRPTTGTALERVFGFYVTRGELGELIDQLTAKAKQAKGANDEQVSGRHWMVVGLLQLQRGEEAAAVAALAQAEAALTDNSLAAYHHGQALLLLGQTDAAQ